MTFKTEFNKVMLAEGRPGYRMHTLSWLKDPASNAYYTPLISSIVIGPMNKKIYFANEADNIIVDGGMEAWTSPTNLTNWTELLTGTSTVNQESASQHGGTYCVRLDIDGSNSSAYIYQNKTLVLGEQYRLKVWYKTTGGATAALQLYTATGISLGANGLWSIAGVYQQITLPAAATWTMYSLNFTNTTGATAFTFNLKRGVAISKSIYFDDVAICPKRIATLTEATYATMTDLCAEMKSKMDAAGSGVHTITFDSGVRKVTIASATLLYLFLTTITDALWETIEFPVVADSDFALSHTGNAISFPIYFPEIVGVKEDGIALTQRATLALVQANASSWYLDFFNGVLYVHLSGGDDPGGFTSPSYHHSVIATVVFCFSNRQFADEDLLDFIPYGCTYNHYYEPTIRSGGASSISQGLADHYTGAMQTTFGELLLADAGWWYKNRKSFLWNNKDWRILIGEKGDAYGSFEVIFVGRGRNPKVSNEGCSIELTDSHAGQLQAVPPSRYDVTTYPNLDTNAVDRPIPILFGEKTNITPTQIDTTAFKFKISQTIFDGVAYALQSIDAVYKDGVVLTNVTDYAKDLTNGEFTLVNDPGNSQITCDAKGIKDQFDFSTGAKTDVYSENVADHLYFILNVVNKIAVAMINLASFLELQTARAQKVAWFLDEATDTLEFNRLLQQTSLYHFLMLGDGTFAARYYRRTIPTGTLTLRNVDLNNVKMTEQSDGIYRDVVVKYAKDPTTGNWKTVSSTATTAEYEHDEKSMIEIETALRDASEAAAILAFYSTLFQRPADKIECDTSLIARNVVPSDKIVIVRSVELDDGSEINVNDEDDIESSVYVILNTRKDLSGGKISISGQIDYQLSIYAVHSDTPHTDDHGDHSDSYHGDGEHSDAHTDEYTDTPHADYHADTSHVDQHYDVAYVDHLDVGWHDDEAHTDYYSDLAHVDEAHQDTAYVDSYADVPHEDSAHADHTDDQHVDSYADIAHIDSET